MYSILRDRMFIAPIVIILSGGAQAASDDHEWAGILSASFGYDDNLTLEDDTSATASELKDNYLEVLGSARRYVSGVRNDGLRISGTLFRRQYLSESDFDFFQLGGGVGYDKTFPDWKARFDAGFDNITYGGEDYQQVTKFGAEVRRRMTKKTELRLRFQANFFDAGVNYSNLDGTRQFVRAETRIKQAKNRYRLSYTYQTNDRDGSRTATTFSSASPNRHILRANARVPINSKLRGEFDVRYRISRYQEPNVLADSTTITREDDRLRTRLGVEYKQSNKTKLFGRYDYYNNDSNTDSRSYKRSLISVGINYSI